MKQSLFATSLLLFAAHAAAQCTILAPGTQVLPTPVDSWSTIQPIGFSFPFCGTNYTGLYVTDHGVIALTNNGTPAVPTGGSFVWNPSSASLITSSPMVAPYWSDHTPGVAGQVWIDNTSGSRCTVTWLNMETFGSISPLTPFTMQATLYPSGQITLCLDNRVVNSGSTFGALNAIMAVTSGTGGTLGPAIDISTSPVTANNVAFEEWVTTAPNTANPNFDVGNKTITLIPTNPGWVFVTDALACAATTSFGSGCDNLSLSSSPPILGANWTLTTTGVAPVSPIAITFFGTGPLPGVPLPTIGLPS